VLKDTSVGSLVGPFGIVFEESGQVVGSADFEWRGAHLWSDKVFLEELNTRQLYGCRLHQGVIPNKFVAQPAPKQQHILFLPDSQA
jgi:hypothetical protein